VSSLQELYRLESCNLASEEDEAKLQWLDCNSATEEEEDEFALLEGWLSAADLRWNSLGGLPLYSG
jgi:hypothetical protein